MQLAFVLVLLCCTILSAVSLSLPPSSPSDHDHETRLTKRQDYLAQGIRAVFGYRCTHSGPKMRTFRWEFRYHIDTDTVDFIPIENVSQHSHVTRITNDFAAHWYDRWCEMQGDLCCLYLAKARTMGTIHDDSLETWLVTSRIDREEKPKIVEVCMRVDGAHDCQRQCPVIDIEASECRIRAILISYF